LYEETDNNVLIIFAPDSDHTCSAAPADGKNKIISILPEKVSGELIAKNKPARLSDDLRLCRQMETAI
jgi:hypothetical protein